MKPCNTNAWGFLASFAALTPLVAANADKIIFTGPAPITYPLASPSLSDLNLDALSAPSNLTLRTHLSRTFHDDSDPENEGKPRGQASWFLLDDLTQGQRYELRVCWAAIEPTEFTMTLHEVDAVFETPALLQSLYEYTKASQDSDAEQTRRVQKQPAEEKERTASVLLLQVHAAADYFSHHPELMDRPPPVLVDLILDPYLYNAVPSSLILTAAYILLVSVGMLFIAKRIANGLSTIAALEDTPSKKRD